jgi:hypothetical protein
MPGRKPKPTWRLRKETYLAALPAIACRVAACVLAPAEAGSAHRAATSWLLEHGNYPTSSDAACDGIVTLANDGRDKKERWAGE